MKKLLKKIAVYTLCICLAFVCSATLYACEEKPLPLDKQEEENASGKEDNTSPEDSREETEPENASGGIWTPPVNQDE